MPETASVIDELVAANHILFDQGVVDGFGHVSVRHPTESGRFLLARSIAPALVTPADIMAVRLRRQCSRRGWPRALPRTVHPCEIYRARPDAGAVVHSHSPAVVPFSVAKHVPLRAVWHLGGVLGEGVRCSKSAPPRGPATDLLIRDRGSGAALAKSLGAGSVVLMRGHGCTVVGSSVRQAVFNAVYTEISAALQSEAMRLGTVIYLTREEAEAAAACNAAQIDRSWELWKLRAQHRRLQLQA